MRKAKTNTKNDAWFLQGDDGTIYGPVDTATLKTWCQEGRIEPDSAISQDRKTWVDAASVDVLEMDWIARLEDGSRHGPFHLNIVPGLIENGIIPADAMLENRHTGELRPATPRPVADDLFPDWNPNPIPQARAPKVAPAGSAERAPAREDAHPPDEQRKSLPLMEGERPREPIGGFASTSDAPPDEVFPDEGWPADEPVEIGGTAVPEDPQAADGQDDERPLSKRLEPLQRSATEARQQLVETRQAMQALRKAHTVLQDESQRLKDELAAASKARQNGEQQLLEQQDRTAAAEAEVEDLKAQIGQVKDHYERMQLENQNQFEKIDTLQAAHLANEQRFKSELADLRDRADTKTELLAGTVQFLMRDGDVARRLKSVPVAAAADNQTEPLKATIRHLEQQLEHERRQARHPLPEPVAAPRRGPLPAILLFLAGALLSAVSVAIIQKGCAGPADDATPPPSNAATGTVTAAAITEEREFSLETAGPLDLQPEARTLPEASAEPAEEGAALAIQWPALSLPSARIQPSAETLRIVFNEGLFSVSARLTPEAETALQSVAEQLNGKLNGQQLIIEGHTDATPMASAGSRYVDNFALGMARAEAVKTFLEQTGKVPASSMRTSSAGDSAPPFSNESEADRKRNRTAVLTLVAHPQ